MRIVSSAAFCLAMLLLVTAWVAPTSAAPVPAGEELVAAAHRVVDLVNLERTGAGLLPLKWNDSLAKAATVYAQDMAARNFFAHNSPEGSTPSLRAQEAGFPAYPWGAVYVGENLARGQRTPEEAMKGWMASDGHRTNLLNPKYRETGVGVAIAPSGARVWAQEFGSRPMVLPVFINADAATTDSRRVSLSISTEEVSNRGSLGKPTGMMVSNSPDFAGASWEPFSRAREWTLVEEPGLRRVYVRIRDGGGTVAESSAEIRLTASEATAPLKAQAVALQVPETSRPASGAQTLDSSRQQPLFKLGFGLLAGLLRDTAGLPLEDEHYGANGDSLQRTTTGLMVWRKLDNWTAFTDGYRTWINGPLGIQQRANDERFGWER